MKLQKESPFALFLMAVCTVTYVMTQMLINLRNFALLLQFLVVVILNREYVVLSYKCTPFFLLQLICGLGIIKVNQLALSMVLCQ